MKKTFTLLNSIVFLIVLGSCSSDSGELIVTYTKGEAIYGDLESIRATPLVSGVLPLVDAGKIYLGDEYILIGEEKRGIHVYDNQDPNNPIPKLFINIPGNREYYVEDNFLFAESLYDMLKIDISNPLNPQLISRIENAISTTITNHRGEVLVDFNFETVTEEIDIDSDIYSSLWNSVDNFVYYDYENNLIPPSAVPSSFAGNSNNQAGTVNRISALNGYVYVISKAVLSVYEIDQFSQVFTGGISFNMETIYPFSDRIFIGTNNSVEIYDVSNPAEPMYEGSFWHATSCDPVLPVSENIAYATLRTGEFAQCPGDINALVILDISNQNLVSQIQEIEMQSPYGLAMINTILYVGEGENGLKSFNAENPGNPSLISWNRDVTAYDVLAHPTNPNILLITGPDGFQQYQLAPSSELQLLSSIVF